MAGLPWQLPDILPEVRRAGESAGRLTAAGAKLLDKSGVLAAGSLMAPPEGDAGTGMVSTNAVRKRTGNISVGTSAFSMNVLEKPLKTWHRDIDVVTTPDGAPVAMVHTNNCSSDINAWVKLFGEFAEYLGVQVTPDDLYKLLFVHTAKAAPDAGGLVNYSYLSGENITRVEEGRPLFVRSPHSWFNLPNFMLSQLYAAFAPLKIGMDILTKEENIQTDVMVAQGGLFRTPIIAQQVLANILGLPITIMDTAEEGGPWGMAVLALYAAQKTKQPLADYLDTEIFRQNKSRTLMPEPVGVEGGQRFIERYQKALPLAAEAAVLPDYTRAD
jgi:L-ribulokinase